MEIVKTDIPKDELDLFDSLKGIKVVFDVGARTDIEYIKLKPNIELHAFEPNPVFFAELVSRIGERPKTFLNNVGVGDISCEREYNNIRQAFVGGDEKGFLNGQVVLPITTLNDYCRGKGIQQIDFLKIDTEGYDYKVLQGASDIVKKCRYIQYEHWDDKLKFHGLLEDDFIMSYIGHRNVFCQRKW